MHRLRRLLPLAGCALALAAVASADEGAAPPPPATGEGVPRAPQQGPEESRPKPEQPPPNAQDTWLDTGHAFVEQRIFAPVLRLDRFFSDERDIDAERARSFLQWRSELRFSEPNGMRPAFTTGVRANLRLPGLNRRLNRLRIVIEGETRDAVSALFPRAPTTEPADAEQGVESGETGLRFFLLDTLVAHADLGAGVLFKLPPGVFGRLRFRWAIPVTRTLLYRTALSGFWRTDTRFGSSATGDLERPLSSVLVARLSGTATLTEVSRGVEWNGDLSVVSYLTPRAGAQVGAAVAGATRNALVVVPAATPTFLPTVRRAPDLDRYRLYTRLRGDVYRRWIFMEIEPEIAWPWTVDRGRHAEWGVAFRLEVQFQGKERPPTPPAPEPEEPRDPEPEGTHSP